MSKGKTIPTTDPKGILRRYPVTVIAGISALVSFLISSDRGLHIDMTDISVISLLFVMMASVSGLKDCGWIDSFAHRILGKGSARRVCSALVVLPLVTSPFITNDVSLILFVPLAILILGRSKALVPVLVLQTVGANMASALLPFGNPQNLFIYTAYDIPLHAFVSAILPTVFFGVVAVSVISFTLRVDEHDIVDIEPNVDKGPLLWFSIIVFIIGIMGVLKLIPFWVPLMLALCYPVVRGRLFYGVDLGLLLTFLFLFILVGNISSISAISDGLAQMMVDHPVSVPVLASQFVSNVPATVMLAPFTSDWSSLLIGVTVGGLGTPIASMASVITFGYYAKCENRDWKRFVVLFTTCNFALLALLLLVL